AGLEQAGQGQAEQAQAAGAQPFAARQPVAQRIGLIVDREHGVTPLEGESSIPSVKARLPGSKSELRSLVGNAEREPDRFALRRGWDWPDDVYLEGPPDAVAGQVLQCCVCYEVIRPGLPG